MIKKNNYILGYISIAVSLWLFYKGIIINHRDAGLLFGTFPKFLLGGSLFYGGYLILNQADKSRGYFFAVIGYTAVFTWTLNMLWSDFIYFMREKELGRFYSPFDTVLFIASAYGMFSVINNFCKITKEE